MFIIDLAFPSLPFAIILIFEEKDEAVSSDSIEDYQKAAELKTQECSLLDQIDALKKRMKPKELTVQDIANVIESWTKIPVNKITEEERLKYIELYCLNKISYSKLFSL